jgi:hypothetical protein
MKVLVALTDSDSSGMAIGAISTRVLEFRIVRHTSETGSGTIDRHLRRSPDAWDDKLLRYRWGWCSSKVVHVFGDHR